MKNLSKAPTWFLVVAILALLWNLMGVGAYISQTMMTPEMLAELKPAEKALYENMPIWANVVFFLAVVGGTLGSLGLILKKKWALPLFTLSLVGVVLQLIYNVFISNSLEVYGPSSLVMSLMIPIAAIALIWLSKKAIGNNWIA